MSSLPKISIIIPNYNHARFLRKRLDSVLNQTYHDFEIIYLDDASTDESNEIVTEYNGDRRIQIAVNKKNTGIPFKQWNKGVQMARGEYIWIAESDDYADETFLEKLIVLLENNPTVGLAYCQSMSVDEDSNIISLWEPSGIDSSRWKMDFVNNGIDECRHYLNTVNTIPNVSAIVFRKRVYEKVGYAPENMKLAGDWLTWIKMLLVSDIAHLAEPLNFFRRSTQSVSVHAFVSSLRVKERYLVSGYILKNIDFDNETRQLILDKLLADWLIFAKSKKWWNICRENLEIYSIVKKIDPNLFRRFLGKH